MEEADADGAPLVRAVTALAQRCGTGMHLYVKPCPIRAHGYDERLPYLCHECHGSHAESAVIAMLTRM